MLRRIRGWVGDRLRSRSASDDWNPDWAALVEEDRPFWDECLRKAEKGPRVLLATYVGGHPQFTVLESALAAALTLRGARVDLLLCREDMPACLRAKISGISPEAIAKGGIGAVFCRHCIRTGSDVFEGMGLPVFRMGETLSRDNRSMARSLPENLSLEEIRNFEWRGIPVGEHAFAGALRYYGRGTIEAEPGALGVAKRYLEGALLTAQSAERLQEENGYDVCILNHGIYAPHGVTGAVCRSRGVRVVTWNIAYRKQCAIFSHGDTYHHTLLEEPVESWENMDWSAEHEKKILDYLESRRRGTRDWIWFNRDADEDVDRFAAETGLNWKKPVIGMLTNVIWDAQLHYRANAFPNMVDWALRTIEHFSKRPDLQLLIRIHPGELAPPGGVTKSRQPMGAEIRKAFPILPPNVFVIPPESKVSTYATMMRCDSVLLYGTKTGVELTSLGIPVVVAGEAWIRNKGLTMDASTPGEYFDHLRRLPHGQRMDDVQVKRARKYAYHFFFRRMIPLPFLEPREGWPPYRLSLRTMKDLLPGAHPGLDTVCEGILGESEFIYPAERQEIQVEC